jgi:hypothetical protein
MPVKQGWKDIIRHIIIMIEQCSRNQRPRLPLSRRPRRRPSGEDGPHHARVLTTSRLSKLGGSRQDSDCDLSRQFPPARAGRLTRPSQKRPRPGYTPATCPVPGDGKRIHRAPGNTGEQLPFRRRARAVLRIRAISRCPNGAVRCTVRVRAAAEASDGTSNNYLPAVAGIAGLPWALFGGAPVGGSASWSVRQRAGPFRGDDRVELRPEQVLVEAHQGDELLVDGSCEAAADSGVGGHDGSRGLRR